MAYVAITDRLLNDVGYEIDRLRAKEVAAMPSEAEVVKKLMLDSVIISYIEDKLWEPERDLRERLQKYDYQVRVDVRLRNLERNELSSFSVSVSTPCFLKNTYYDVPTVEFDLDHPLVTEYWARKEFIDEANERWGKVRQQVGNFLGKAKSLNEAAKLWPDVLRYVPQSYIDRLNKEVRHPNKVETEAEKALKEMDLDLITASTTIARMSSSE